MDADPAERRRLDGTHGPDQAAEPEIQHGEGLQGAGAFGTRRWWGAARAVDGDAGAEEAEARG